MKKILLCLLLLVIVHLSLKIEDCSSQDYLTSIGRSYLRYDADSNRLRLGGPGTIKFAREFNVALFDFNSSHFNWSNSTGLNLNSALLNNSDSLTTLKLKIKRDSVLGETIWTKEYNIYRPFYCIYDSTLISIRYKNSKWNTTAEWFLINKIDTESDSTEKFGLTETLTALRTWTVPHGGVWKIKAFFDFEIKIDTVINWGCTDSIYCVLDYEEPATKAHWLRKFYVPYNTKFGESGSGYIELILPRGITEGNFYARCTNNALYDTDKPLLKYIYNLRIVRELVN